MEVLYIVDSLKTILQTNVAKVPFKISGSLLINPSYFEDQNANID